jgi:hypothetical protein
MEFAGVEAKCRLEVTVYGIRWAGRVTRINVLSFETGNFLDHPNKVSSDWNPLAGLLLNYDGARHTVHYLQCS